MTIIHFDKGDGLGTRVSPVVYKLIRERLRREGEVIFENVFTQELLHTEMYQLYITHYGICIPLRILF